MISVRATMMEAVQKENWYFMVLLISLTLLTVSEQKHPGSMVELKDGMVLDCLCPWNGTFSMVSWTKVGESSPLAVYHPSYGMNFVSGYEGRVRFLRASLMDGSISITNVSEQDLGLYHCSLQTFPHGSWMRHVRVEKPVLKSSPAPHDPKNRTVTLSCPHPGGGALYEVIVEKVEGAGGESHVLASCRLMEAEVKVAEFLDGGKVNCTDGLEVKLHLSDGEAEEDGGFYRCNFSTDTGNYSSIVPLTTPPNPELKLDSNRRWIYIGGGAAGALILMGLTIYCIRFHRRMERRVVNCNRSYITKKQQQEKNRVPEQTRVYDRMKRTAKDHKKQPIYANIHTARAQRNGKR